MLSKIIRILLIILFGVVVVKIGIMFFFNNPDQTIRMRNQNLSVASSKNLPNNENVKYELPNGVRIYLISTSITSMIDSCAVQESLAGNLVDKKTYGQFGLMTVKQLNGDCKMIFGYPAKEKGKWVVLEKKVSTTIEGYLSDENTKLFGEVCKVLPNYPGSTCQYFMDRAPTGFIAILNSKSAITLIDSFYRKEMLDKKWNLLKDTTNTQIYQKNGVLCALNISADEKNEFTKIGIVILR